VTESANFLDDSGSRSVWLAGRAPRQAEREQHVALERARYLVGDLPSLEDPQAELECVGGPYDAAAPGGFHSCGCAKWPVRFRPQEGGGGEYVLVYQWVDGEDDV
jgi:hypothetical protein